MAACKWRTAHRRQEIKHDGSAEPWRAACKRARCLKLKFVCDLYMSIFVIIYLDIHIQN